MIRVLLVDDHELFRSGMKSILESSNEITVVAEANSGEESLTAAQQASPDVILMDVNMPGMSGKELSLEDV